MPWITPEAIRKLPKGKQYSFAWVLDPLFQQRLGQTANPVKMSQQRHFGVNSTEVQSGEGFRELVKKWDPFGFNVMFALESGDIGYQATAVIPVRDVPPVYGLFTKNAAEKTTQWTGLRGSDTLPSIVNPSKGYIVSTNNQVLSHRAASKDMITPIYYAHRAVRINELLEELIANAAEKPIGVKQMQEV